MMMGKHPIVKDLVLLGGGHSHVEVLRSFGMKPLPGVRLTLVTRDMHTPYSGMLPGYISGFYSYDDCHIDLARLANFAQARLVHAEAAAVDTEARTLVFPSRPPLEYDVLSINVGITPASGAVPGAQQYATAVKPIDRFAAKLDRLFERYRAGGGGGGTSGRTAPFRVVVVGGGAGGVEVCLALRHRLEEERKAAGLPEGLKAQVTLVTRGALLDGHASAARQKIARSLREHGVELVEGDHVVSVQDGAAALASGRMLAWDECVWCTGASAPAWLASCGLPTDAQGFLPIGESLQLLNSSSDRSSSSGTSTSTGGRATGGNGAAAVEGVFSSGEIFAAGDVASCAAHPRPKAGVFAVRQGPPLTRNLRAYLTGQPLERFIPQTTNLSLISTGDRYCVGTKGWLTLEGSLLWTWKDSIDRAFMDKYGSELPAMREKMMASASAAQQPSNKGEGPSASSAYSAAGPGALELLAEARMRCGGCGSKVGSSILSRVLSRLRQRQRQQQQQQQQQQPSASASAPSSFSSASPLLQPASPHSVAEQQPQAASPSPVVVGLDHPDDAALVRPPPPGRLLLHTVDFFRSFWSDPFVFGRIAANHALGDCYAMGGTPRTALALCVVPFAAERKMEAELTQMLAGAVEVLDAAGCELVGGHTSEGDEAALGFTINGDVEEGRVLGKDGLRAGQALIVTKGLGTGALMAAAMQGKAKGRWVAGALQAMQQSGGAAAQLAAAHGATACTDVTGFGLLGHLVEMARPSGVHVHLDLDAVPLLPGASECVVGQGILSSLHRQNVSALAALTNPEQLRADARWPLLVDPQTAGGMLFGVPESEVQACLEELRAAGYADAAVIGRVVAPQQQQDVGGTAAALTASGPCVTVVASSWPQ